MSTETLTAAGEVIIINISVTIVSIVVISYYYFLLIVKLFFLCFFYNLNVYIRRCCYYKQWIAST